MSYLPLEDRDSSLIKAHILDPENSPLPPMLQGLLTRAVSMSRLLDKHPLAKNAIKFHMIQYPEISLRTAYRDLDYARKVFNNYQNFDFDFWMNWTIGNITRNIQKCESTNLSSDRKIMALEHSNLVKLLGKRPVDPSDPLRNEKHSFYIMVNIRNKNVKLDLDTLHKLPVNTIQDLNRALIDDDEIDEQGAAEIMNS